MPAPTPTPFQMVDQVMALPDGQGCSLHVTVTRAEPIDAYDNQGERRFKQFLLVEDGAGKKVGVRWFGPKFDLRAGDFVQMYPGAKDDRAACRIDTDNSGKRIVKVSSLGMVFCSGTERPPVLPEASAPASTQQQPAAGGAPPNYSQPGNGQQRPATANGGPAPVTRQRYDHNEIMALQRFVYADRLLLVAENSQPAEMPYKEVCDIATRLTHAIVKGVVDGRVDLAAPSGNGPPADDQPPGPQAGAGPGEGDADEIPF